MVPFAGYCLPVQYPDRHHRRAQLDPRSMPACSTSPIWGRALSGSNGRAGDLEADHAAVAALVEPLVCADIAGLKPGQMRYTLLLNEQGRHPRRPDDRPRRAIRQGPARSISWSMPAPRTPISPASRRRSATRPRLEPRRRRRAAGPAGAGSGRGDGRTRSRGGRTRLHDYGSFDWRGDEAGRLALRLYRRGRLRNPRVRPSAGRGALGRARSPTSGSSRSDLAPATRLRLEAGAAALWPRARRDRVAGRGRAQLRAVEAPPRRAAISPAPTRILGELADGHGAHPRRPPRRGRPGPRRAPKSSTPDGNADRPRHLRRLFAHASARAIALGFVPPALAAPGPGARRRRARPHPAGDRRRRTALRPPPLFPQAPLSEANHDHPVSPRTTNTSASTASSASSASPTMPRSNWATSSSSSFPRSARS